MFSIFLWIGAALATEPVVKVLNGSYCGLHLPQFDQDIFLGIPYAQGSTSSQQQENNLLIPLADTGGQNRFRIPQSLDTSWDGVRYARNYSDACPDNDPQADAIYGMSENCLSINIVRPAGIDSKTRYPVMLWIHGGR